MPHPAFEQFAQVAAKLLADVDAVTKLHGEAATGFTSRALVKTLFTYLEGHLYAFKQAVLALETVLTVLPPITSRMTSKIILYTDEERAMLEEFTYDLSGGGHARKQIYRPRLAENIKFTVAVFHRAIHLQSRVDFNSAGWNRLLDAQRIRNRITHPKSSECLDVSDEDVRIVDEGVQWYDATIQHMLKRFEEDSICAPRFKKSTAG